MKRLGEESKSRSKIHERIPWYGNLFMVGFCVLLFVGMSWIWLEHRVPKVVDWSLEQTVKNVIPSVVHIQYQGEVSWQGSGVIISKDGLILTARHVCEEPGKFIITLPDKRVFVTNRACVGRGYDIGFLRIIASDLPAAGFGDSNDVGLGARLLAIGSPFGKQNYNSVTLGVLSGQNRSFDDVNAPGYGWSILFQSDVAANPGNSGGPVFNMDGEIVGIVVGGTNPLGPAYAGITYCVPSNICKSLIKSSEAAFALQEVRSIENDPLEERINRLADAMLEIGNHILKMDEAINGLDDRLTKIGKDVLEVEQSLYGVEEFTRELDDRLTDVEFGETPVPVDSDPNCFDPNCGDN